MRGGPRLGLTRALPRPRTDRSTASPVKKALSALVGLRAWIACFSACRIDEGFIRLGPGRLGSLLDRPEHERKRFQESLCQMQGP